VVAGGVEVAGIDAFGEVLQVIVDLPGGRVATLQEGPGTATVFRRGRALPADADRIRSLRLLLEPTLDPDLVPLPVAEVVLGEEPLVAAELEVGEPNRSRLVGEPEPTHPVGAIVPAVDAEPMEMEVAPAERALEYVMEVGKRAVAAHQEPPPDHRADPADPDVELVDGWNGLTGHDLGQGNQTGSRSSAPGLFHSLKQ
jgi:hypothetical protein